MDGFTRTWEQPPGRRDLRVVFRVSRAASLSSPDPAATSSIIHHTNFKGLLCRRQQSIAVCRSFKTSRCVSTSVPPSSSERASRRPRRRARIPSTSLRRPTTPSTSSRRCRSRLSRSSRRTRSRSAAMAATWATWPSVGTGTSLLTGPFLVLVRSALLTSALQGPPLQGAAEKLHQRRQVPVGAPVGRHRVLGGPEPL